MQVEKQEDVSVDDMGSKIQHGPALLALMAVILAVSVSALRSELLCKYTRRTRALPHAAARTNTGVQNTS